MAPCVTLQSPPIAGGRLFVVAGLPGAGKTALARVLEGRHGAVRLSPDEEMARRGIDLFDARYRDALEHQMVTRAAQLLTLGKALPSSWTRRPRNCGAGCPGATPGRARS